MKDKQPPVNSRTSSFFNSCFVVVPDTVTPFFTLSFPSGLSPAFTVFLMERGHLARFMCGLGARAPSLDLRPVLRVGGGSARGLLLLGFARFDQLFEVGVGSRRLAGVNVLLA